MLVPMFETTVPIVVVNPPNSPPRPWATPPNTVVIPWVIVPSVAPIAPPMAWPTPGITITASDKVLSKAAFQSPALMACTMRTGVITIDFTIL